MRQNEIVQRAALLMLDNYAFMLTLTYNNDMLRSVVDSNGFRHCYADYTDFSLMVKRIRKNFPEFPPFRYLVVSEYGHKKHRPHFHAVIFVKKSYFRNQRDAEIWAQKNEFFFLHQWQRNVNTKYSARLKKYVGNTRNPIYKNLCTYKEKYIHGRLFRNYDFHLIQSRFVDGERSDVTSAVYYVTKYVMKFDDWITRKQRALRLNLSDEEYKSIWKLIRPRCVFSHDVDFQTDSVRSIIHDSLDFSVRKWRKYVSPRLVLDGKVMPLSVYFQNQFPVDYQQARATINKERTLAGLDYSHVEDYNNPIARKTKAEKRWKSPQVHSMDLDFSNEVFDDSNPAMVSLDFLDYRSNDDIKPNTDFYGEYITKKFEIFE